jgi:thiol-disulfide isomerase/thioredoxin
MPKTAALFAALLLTLPSLLARARAEGGMAQAREAKSAKPPRIEDRVRGRSIAAASPPLERPALRTVAEASHMRDDDLVFGVTLGGQARAYPWWVAKNFHVVDDVVGGEPVALAFCEQCSGAAAFRRTVDGRTLVFEVAGVYSGTIILRDRQTRSLWAPFSGRALEGPLAGRKLERLPLSVTRWDEWTARHPRGEVVWAPPTARAGHGSWYEPGKWGIVTEMGDTLQAWDPRLPENELVYGIESGVETGTGTETGKGDATTGEDSRWAGKAYPIRFLRQGKGIVNDTAAGVPVVVVARGPLDVAGFDRRARGRELTFLPSTGSQAVMNDVETGSDWSGDGEALSGPLRGERLKLLDGYVVEWHVWSSQNPAAVVADVPDVATSAVPDSLSFPALSLMDLDGQARPITFMSSVNLIVLWAAWCPTCKDEMPRLARLVETHAGRGLSAVGIAIHIPDEDERAEVRRFAKQARLGFPTLLVDEAAYDRLDALSRATGGPGVVLPTVFATDREGRILSVLRGKDVEGLPARLESLLDRQQSADR